MNTEESYYKVYNRIKPKLKNEQRLGNWESYFHHQNKLHDYLTECELMIKMMEGEDV